MRLNSKKKPKTEMVAGNKCEEVSGSLFNRYVSNANTKTREGDTLTFSGMGRVYGYRVDEGVNLRFYVPISR